MKTRPLLYIVSSLSQKGASVLFILSLTYLLPSNYFVTFGILVSLTQVLVPIATLSAHTSVGRLMFDANQGKREETIETLFSTGLILATINTTIAVSIIHYTNILPDYNLHWLTSNLYIAGFVLHASSGTLVRSKGEAKKNFSISLFYGWAPCILLVFCAINFPETLALESALALSSFSICVFCYVHVRKYVRIARVSIKAYKSLVSYGWPLSFYLFFLAGYTSGSRIIANYLGLESGAEALTLLVFIIGVKGSLTRSVFESVRSTIGDAYSKGEYTTVHRVLKNASSLSLRLISTASLLIILAYFTAGNLLPENYRVDISQILIAIMITFLDILCVRGNWNIMLQKKTKHLMIIALASFTSALSFLLFSLYFGEYEISVELVLTATLIGHLVLSAASNSIQSPFSKNVITTQFNEIKSRNDQN